MWVALIMESEVTFSVNSAENIRKQKDTSQENKINIGEMD